MLRRHCQFFGSAMAELQYNRRAFTAGMASLLLCPVSTGLVHGQQLERSSLKLGVANKAHLYYLPVTIAERRGHFRDYGLAIAMIDFEGGGESLDAVLAGSVDVAVGAYEHTLRAQGMGKDIRAAIELGRFPGIVLAVGKDRTFKSLADLKGLKIGVTAPNSSSYFFVLYVMAKAGLAPGDASFLGVGGGQRAVDAMKAGEIDAISNLDPVITRLQQDGRYESSSIAASRELITTSSGAPTRRPYSMPSRSSLPRTRRQCRRWSTLFIRLCDGLRPQPRTKSWMPCRLITFSASERSTLER
jgi:NMT1/THI5 like